MTVNQDDNNTAAVAPGGSGGATMASGYPVRRRNSTYLALACANAVSQGSMTRRVRQIFEARENNATAAKPVQPVCKPMRRNSFNPLINDQMIIIEKTTTPALPAPPAPLAVVTPDAEPPVASAASSASALLCEKCSTVLGKVSATKPQTSCTNKVGVNEVAKSAPDAAKVAATAATPNDAADQEKSTSPAKLGNKWQVADEELPKQDTVKNARTLFEANCTPALPAPSSGALQHPHYSTSTIGRFQKTTSSSSSSSAWLIAPVAPVSAAAASSAMIPLNTMTLGRSPGERALRGMVYQQPDKLIVPVPNKVDDETPAASGASDAKGGYVVAVGRMASLRWPSRKENQLRSPSPPAPEYPAAAAPAPQQRSGGRRYWNRSRCSTDVESYVSEAGSDWSSSDVESEASYPSSTSSGRDSVSDPEGRYVSPAVLEKIRSYGMTLTYVNGRMLELSVPPAPTPQQQQQTTIVDPDSAGDSDEESAVFVHIANGPNINSAGLKYLQSLPKTTNHVADNNNNNNNNNNPSRTSSSSSKRQSRPRIIGCLPKTTELRQRHSSAESTTSSGISSGRNSDAEPTTTPLDSSPTSTPFSTLKKVSTTTQQATDNDLTRCPSPGPIGHQGVKLIAASPFGLYSVVYNFRQL